MFFTPHWTTVFYYIFTALWLLEFVLFPNRFKGSTSERQSFYAILTRIIAGILLTIGLTLWDITAFKEPQWRLFGLSLYAVGLYLRYHASFVLGAQFTRHVEVERDQTLVSTGPYRLFRHPLYLGLFLLGLATPVFFGNLLALAISGLALARVLNRRMRLEEQMLETHLHQDYRAWKEKRYRFIPWIY